MVPAFKLCRRNEVLSPPHLPPGGKCDPLAAYLGKNRDRKTVMIMWVIKRILFAAVSLSPVSAALAQAHPSGECFDALVTARIIRQLPSPLPNCGSNCIIVAWPWRLDVEVEQVAKGTSSTGPQTLLALQHSYLSQDQRRIQAWLRRHSGGGFNIVKLADGVDLAPCPVGSKPARPYLAFDL